jgi:tRNA threonylcarbamoyladenosine biosynthesis protein TsaB
MITIAVDTSTPVGGIALFDSISGLMGEIRFGTGRKHSEQVIRGIEFMLESAKVEMDDICFFSVAIGPGSFTGLRVGLSTVKGLSFATGKPVVAVSTLDAMGLSFSFTEKLICPMFNARRSEVYTALFKWTDKGHERVMEDSVLQVGRLIERIDEDTLFVGNGAELYRQELLRNLGDKAHFPSRNMIHPLPSSFCIAGLRKAEVGEFDNPITITPVYLRKSEAEIQSGRQR